VLSALGTVEFDVTHKIVFVVSFFFGGGAGLSAKQQTMRRIGNGYHGDINVASIGVAGTPTSDLEDCRHNTTLASNREICKLQISDCE
jgi:hypothetical protein